MADPAIDLTSRDSFPFWTREIIRFADLDRYGHVNNVAFAVFAESGRVHFFEEVTPGSCSGSGIGWVIVKLTVDFLAQAHYPGEVEVGSRITRIGTSSCLLVQGLFNDGRCFGTTESVCVWADVGASKSLPIPDPVRGGLARYMRPAG
jgi:acyl-CoA thioester hydrolase